MPPQATSPEANVELLRGGFDDLNTGDLDACVARPTPDLVMNLAELAEPMRGTAIWRQNAEMMKRAFPDLHARVDDIFASQDRVAVPSLSPALTPVSSWVSPRPDAASATSATSSTASPTA